MQDNKYITDINNVLKTIDEYGVAIIPNVLNEKKCKSMNDGMWDFLEHITQKFDIPIDRSNNKTWKEFIKLYPMNSMIIQRYGIGHAQYIWDIRQNSKVVEVFSKIWDVHSKNLIVSFDGASCHLSPEVLKRGWYIKNKFHCDQSFTRNNLDCIQSWVTANDTDEKDATLLFLEKSNLYHKEAAEKFNLVSKQDWHVLTPDQIKFYQKKGCEIKRIKCKAGSMVLWDSRTIHCGSEPMKKRITPRIRNVAYVCIVPKSRLYEKILKNGNPSLANYNKKKKAFENLRTTNHYPHKPKLFSINPRTYGGDLPNVTEINKPKLTELGHSLTGI